MCIQIFSLLATLLYFLLSTLTRSIFPKFSILNLISYSTYCSNSLQLISPQVTLFHLNPSSPYQISPNCLITQVCNYRRLQRQEVCKELCPVHHSYPCRESHQGRMRLHHQMGVDLLVGAANRLIRPINRSLGINFYCVRPINGDPLVGVSNKYRHSAI